MQRAGRDAAQHGGAQRPSGRGCRHDRAASSSSAAARRRRRTAAGAHGARSASKPAARASSAPSAAAPRPSRGSPRRAAAAARGMLPGGARQLSGERRPEGGPGVATRPDRAGARRRRARSRPWRLGSVVGDQHGASFTAELSSRGSRAARPAAAAVLELIDGSAVLRRERPGTPRSRSGSPARRRARPRLRAPGSTARAPPGARRGRPRGTIPRLEPRRALASMSTSGPGRTPRAGRARAAEHRRVAALRGRSASGPGA